MEEECQGVPFVWVRTIAYSGNNWKRLINMTLFSQNLLRAGQAQAEKPDMIIGSSPNLFAANGAARLSRRLGCRFVLEIRDLWPQTMIDLGYSPYHPMVLLFGAIEKRLYKQAEKIIVLAEGSISYLVTRKSVRPEKICFIPNGVSLESFKPSLIREKAREKYGLSRFTCAYVGAHGPINALETVLDAADKTRAEQIDWLLVGDGPAKKQLQAKAKDMGLGNLRFLDPIPKKEVPDLLHAIDAAIICLQDASAFRYAISPNKLFDYMAAACPILCSIPGEFARMVEEVGCGVAIHPENGTALGDQAVRLRDLSPENRLEMGRRGLDRVRDRYSRKTLGKVLMEFLGC